jgi:hypothetical protein
MLTPGQSGKLMQFTHSCGRCPPSQTPLPCCVLCEICRAAQSLVRLTKALERLNAPVPQRSSTHLHHKELQFAEHHASAPIIPNPFRWPSPRHLSDLEARSLPLRDLVIFVDNQNEDGDIIGYWFVEVLQDLGAEVRKPQASHIFHSSRYIGSENTWVHVYSFSLQER